MVRQGVVMKKRHEAQVTLAGGDRRRVVAAYEAMGPEIGRTTEGTSVQISLHEGALRLHVRADTIPALRALMNSYLRWFHMIDAVLDILEGMIE